MKASQEKGGRIYPDPTAFTVQEKQVGMFQGVSRPPSTVEAEKARVGVIGLYSVCHMHGYVVK